MEYKGFTIKIWYDEEQGCYSGKADGVNVFFDGETYERAEQMSHLAIDSYIEMTKKNEESNQ